MIKQNVQYVVKVLSGVNEGATADLGNTSGLVIGRSAGCDIIFNGANVADRHVAVELDKGRIRLTPLAQPVYIDGRDVGSNEIILQPNQLVNIGTVDFTIADKQQSWPGDDAKTKQLSVSSTTNTQGEYLERRSKSDHSKKTSLFSNPWLWLAAVIMLLANVQYLTKQYGGISGLLGLTETADQRISSMIRVEKYPSIYVKSIDGKIHINGYVSNEAEKSLLKRDISNFEGDVVSHYFVDTELEDNARMIAQSLGENEITFTTLDHGRLKANGLTDNRAKWISVKENIRGDVLGVTSINDDDVKNLREIYSVLEQKVLAEEFSKRLELGLEKTMITARGKLTKAEEARWIQLKREFMDNSPYPFQFRESIRAPDADIKLSIRSVSVGEVPFVVSKEGNKYFKGSHVGSNYYIESINDDHILLNNNNIIFPIYFGQKKE